MTAVFRNPVRRINPANGKEENVVDESGKQLFHPKWRTTIVTHQGKRKTYTFGANKTHAQKQADMLEQREREIRNGTRAVPTPEDKNISRPVTEVFQECFTWGRARGGKRHMPWDDEYADKKQRNLAFWRMCLGLAALGDLYGVLQKIEKEFRAMPGLCNSAQTVSNKVFSFHSLILLRQKRKYLA